MPLNTPEIPNRRDRREARRRLRRRPALIAGGLAAGILATAALTGTAPAPQASAAPVLADFSLASSSVPIASTAIPEVSAASAAAASADTTLAAAASVSADIAASGLDVGDSSIDLTALQDAIDRLDKAETLAAPLLTGFTDSVTTKAATVDARVSQLRGNLDGAIAKKAEEEAAEKARQEAEAAAAAKAAATPRTSSPAAAPVASGGGSGDNSPGGAQAAARGMLGNYGWGDDQFSCLVSLWNKESGWNYQASNRSSGAYGIPQALPGSKMSSAGGDWATNAATQVAWGLGYISGRYGSPCNAWGHSQSVGWY